MKIHAKRFEALLVPVVLSGCFMFNATISVYPADRMPPLTHDDLETASAVITQIAEPAGFFRTEVAATLAEDGVYDVFPYRAFVSFEGGREDKTVSILGMTRTDRREIAIAVRDYERGDPKPSTKQLIESLREALQRAFPDCRVEVTPRRSLRLFGP